MVSILASSSSTEMPWGVGWERPKKLGGGQGVNGNKSHPWCPLSAKEGETWKRSSWMVSVEGDPEVPPRPCNLPPAGQERGGTGQAEEAYFGPGCQDRWQQAVSSTTLESSEF